MEYTLVARVGNDPAAVTRIVSLLRRRGCDVLSLAVGRLGTDRSRCATFVVATRDVRQLVAQLLRLIDVLDVEVLTPATAARDNHAMHALSA